MYGGTYSGKLLSAFSKIFTLHLHTMGFTLGVRDILVTGKSFSEALIFASTNPQYDKRLFIGLPKTFPDAIGPSVGWPKNYPGLFRDVT